MKSFDVTWAMNQFLKDLKAKLLPNLVNVWSVFLIENLIKA
jgi:hypothetical protein